MEGVERGDRGLFRVWRAPLHLAFEPLERPQLLAQLEARVDQRFFGGEMAVQRHLRDLRLGDDSIDADRADAVVGEQLVSGVQDPLAGAACGTRARRGASLGGPQDSFGGDFTVFAVRADFATSTG